MSLPILFQRLEGVAILLSSTYIYFDQNLSIVYFLLFLLAFDVSMLGYIINNKLGAIFYNIGHSLTIPVILIVPYLFSKSELLLGLICIWLAHIGLDRCLGYGLKLEAGFKHTHLGNIGKK